MSKMESLDTIHIEGHGDFEEYFRNSPVHAERQRYENGLMATRRDLESFHLDGFCIACERASPLLVDTLWGGQQFENGWLPNCPPTPT